MCFGRQFKFYILEFQFKSWSKSLFIIYKLKPQIRFNTQEPMGKNKKKAGPTPKANDQAINLAKEATKEELKTEEKPKGKF